MKYRKFGNLGWDVSEIGFGAWAIGGDMWGQQKDSDSIDALNKAVDLGVNFIDTAQGYGKGHSEEIIGRFLKNRNENIYIATKIPPVEGTAWPPAYNQNINDSYPPNYIIEQCEKSLKRLQRDYIDVYQFHTWTSSFNIQNDWFEAMCRLKEQGKIRAIGVSVHDTSPDSVIGSLILEKVDSVQVIYNIFEQYPQFNLFPVCERLHKAVVVRVPFDEGSLTGKYTDQTVFADGDVRSHYFRGNNLKAVVKKVNEIKAFKDKCYPHMPMSEYSLRFAISHAAVSTVIPGIRNVQQAFLNSKASDGNILSPNEKDQLKKFYWSKDFWNNEITNN
jgi:aryl-alcohol dehydrogenase-like predicted oxidoreductase